MKIIVLNYPNTTVDVISAPDELEDVEKFLSGNYCLDEINYMVSDDPLQIHNCYAMETEDGYILEDATGERPLGYLLEVAEDPDVVLPPELSLGERLLFESREAAIAYARAHGATAVTITPKTRYEVKGPIIVDREGQPLHVAVTWPWCQNLFGVDGFRKHSELINYPGYAEDYGSSAYKVEAPWLFSLDEDILNAIEVTAYITPFDETGNIRIPD